MRRRAARFWREDGGAAAVELALVLPLFAAMLFGLVQLGWGLYCRSDVNHAVETASRVYVIDANASDATFLAKVTENLQTVSGESVSITIQRETMASGAQLIHVDWAYGHDLIVPFLTDRRLNFGSSLTVPLAPPL